MSLKHNKESAMPDAALLDMQRITRFAAEPRAPGDSVKAAIGRAARRLGLSYRRAYSFWYASPDAAVRAAEADRVRQEELRLLARRRIELETQMQWIEARLNARESGAHAAVVVAQVGKVLPVAFEGVEEPGIVGGTEGLIPDPRQIGLLGELS